ncbi:MAG: hypothetical protein ACRYG7_46135 [Janthinobacterium lividum]
MIPAALVALAGALLTSCSSPSPATTTGAPAVRNSPQPASQFPFGGKVDSLNGIAGHIFGQPLSAFPKMRLLPTPPGGLTRTYEYEGSEGWFGKHHKQVRTQFYYFLNGRFCRFMALGDPTVLRPEATYLFGPGQAQGRHRLFWEGSRARAAYREQATGMGMEGQFDVLSKALEAEQAAQAQAKLKAENAQ